MIYDLQGAVMPSQRVHDTSCLALSALLATAGVVALKGALFPMAAGAAAGTLIHPDWDYAEIRGVVADLGPLKYLVKPYGWAVPHRHWISHAPLVGTAGRLAYIFLPLLILAQLLVMAGALPFNPVWALLRTPQFWWGALGLALADTLHFAMDMAVTGVKRFVGQLLRGENYERRTEYELPSRD